MFYKQRDAKFFPPTAWAAAMSVTQIPWALVECTLFTLVVYFFVGFYRSAGGLPKCGHWHVSVVPATCTHALLVE